MKPMPAMMTKKTTNSLTATRTRLTRIDSLMPMLTSVVSTMTSRNANRSKCEPYDSADGKVMPRCCRNTPKYADQPCATTLAPSSISSSRSQPMIHATNSPSVAYEKVYAEPLTGTVEANSA
jgi:hypothetical protein